MALIVPHLFRAFWEYQLGLWASVCLLFVVLARDKGSWLYRSRLGLPSIAVATALLPGCVSVVMLGKKEIGSSFPVPLVLVAVYFLLEEVRKDPTRPERERYRSTVAWHCLCWEQCFFSAQELKIPLPNRETSMECLGKGMKSSQPDSRAYSLIHGRIAHGFQFRSEAKRRLPTGYYGLTSGVGLALVELQAHPSLGAIPQNLRIGVIGLGVGTLAAYGKAVDMFVSTRSIPRLRESQAMANISPT